MKCGEKWNKQHRCPDKVALHVLEEVLDALQHASSGDDSKEGSSDEEEDQVFQLSSCAAEGVQGKKTIKLSGLVNNQEILILIDSGSSCTFINEKTAAKLSCTVTPASTVSVTVANGQKLHSDKQVTDFT
jgi:hypothetical protein